MTNLEKWMFYLQDLESPDHFLRWNWYFLISSCLERRIWIGGIDCEIYPNMFLIFVAEPGFGKTQPAKKGERLLRSLVKIKDGAESPIIHTAPDTVSYEKLSILLAKENCIETIPYSHNPTSLYSHTSVSFCLGDELGTLLRDHTNDVVTLLNKGWDCGDHTTDTVKHGERMIKNMCINLLGCCTPDWLGQQLNNNSLHQGFTGRVIFIFGDTPRKRTTLIRVTDEQRTAVNELRKHLVLLTRIKPRLEGLKFSKEDTPEAFEWFDNWVQHRMDIRINSNKHMKHYYSRKKVLLLKLSMSIHFSESLEMELTVDDLKKALKELELNELSMHSALTAGAKNPLFVLSESIKSYLLGKSNVSHKRILLDHYDAAFQGESDILKALVYLKNTDQITSFEDDKKVCRYNLVRRIM